MNNQSQKCIKPAIISTRPVMVPELKKCQSSYLNISSTAPTSTRRSLVSTTSLTKTSSQARFNVVRKSQIQGQVQGFTRKPAVPKHNEFASSRVSMVSPMNQTVNISSHGGMGHSFYQKSKSNPRGSQMEQKMPLGGIARIRAMGMRK